MTQLVSVDLNTGEIVERGNTLPANFEPAKTKENLSKVDAIRELAQKMRDWDLLTKAVDWQLKEQRQFIKWWSAQVRPKGMKESDISDGRYLGVPEAQKLTGIQDGQVSRWRQRLADEAAESKYRELLMKPPRKTASGKLDASMSSTTNEWYTPPKYLEAVRNVFGGSIDLDPASSHVANKNVQAREIFTEQDEGEQLPWFGNVFLNPPYGTVEGKSRAGKFCLKAIEEYESGRVSACIILVNSVHAQSWQQPLYNFPVCFVDHRIQFMDADGEINPNPTFMNIFVYLGLDQAAFAREFSVHGYVMERLRAE